MGEFQIIKNKFFLLFLWLVACTCLAQEVITESYTYDGAGNLIKLDRNSATQAPLITNVQPAFISAGQIIEVFIQGQNFVDINLNANRPEIQLTELARTVSSLRFTIEVPQQALLQPITLSISNDLGEATTTLELLPAISVSPLPALIAQNQQLPIRIRAERAPLTDIEYNLNVQDNSIASIETNRITIPAGALAPLDDPQISGIAPGTTNLMVGFSGTDIINGTIVIGAPEFTPSDGDTFAGAVLEVIKPITPPATTGDLTSQPLQVNKPRVETPNLIEADLLSNQQLIIKGAALTGITPNAIQPGDHNITVFGHGLQTVDQLTLQPAENISVSSLQASPDGRRVTADISVTMDAELGGRTITLSANNTLVPVAILGSNVLNITGDVPVIDFITPLVVNPDSVQTFTLVGSNFSDDSQIRVIPSDGLSIDTNLSINAEQNRINFNMFIEPTALPGTRTIEVITASGSSGQVPEPNNRFTISNDALLEISPLVSSTLVVNKGQVTTTLPIDIASNTLVINKGSLVTAIQPAQITQGNQIELLIQGHALSNVDQIDISPLDGLSMGAPIINDDNISVTINAAANASVGPRQIQALTAGSPIPSLQAASLLQVVAPAPQISSLSPNFVTAGSSQSIVVNGDFFSSDAQVIITPTNGLIVTNINRLNANQMSFDVQADINAELSGRLVQVNTIAGISSPNVQANNTLSVASPQQIDALLPAPALQIIKPPVQTGQVEITPTSTSLQVAFGHTAVSINPTRVNPNSTSIISIFGHALNTVDQVIINPPENITINNIQSDSVGEQLDITLNITADAVPGARQVSLFAAGQQVAFINAALAQIDITGDAPTIDSIIPNSGFPGAVSDFIINGQNLQNFESISFNPAAGITISSTPQVNADGTQINLQIALDDNAAVGERLIQITTPSGISSSILSPNNTFTVLEE